MEFFKWEDVTKINIGFIDEQHKKLVDLTNKLHDSIINQEDDTIIGEVLQELLDYTIYHFKHEEAFMTEYNFMKCNLHKIIHDGFTNQVRQLNEKYKAGERNLSLKTLNFLKDWLINHIGKCDVEYGDFIKSRNSLIN